MRQVVTALPQIERWRRQTGRRADGEGWRCRCSVAPRASEQIEEQVLAGEWPQVDVAAAPFGHAAVALDRLDQRAMASMRRRARRGHVIVAKRSAVIGAIVRPSSSAATLSITWRAATAYMAGEPPAICGVRNTLRMPRSG